MRTPALCCLLSALVALAACAPADQVLVVRTRADGAWQIDARARIAGGLAVFECLHSASRNCYFTLFDKGCVSGGGCTTRCSAKILERFSLTVDSRRALQGLSDFRRCVSHRPGQMRPDCSFADAAAPIARR